MSQVSLAGEDGCVPSSQKAHSKPVLGGACGPVREVPRAGLCTQTELVFPAEVWSFGGKSTSALAFAEETEYEYSGSEEEEDSHGEEGEPRWVWQVGSVCVVQRDNSDPGLWGFSGNGT